MDSGRLEEKTRKFYRNGWRLLKATSVAEMRIDQITGDRAEQLKFPRSAANANCALRTLRRMLHKAEEWKMSPLTRSACGYLEVSPVGVVGRKLWAVLKMLSQSDELSCFVNHQPCRSGPELTGNPAQDWRCGRRYCRSWD